MADGERATVIVDKILTAGLGGSCVTGNKSEVV